MSGRHINELSNELFRAQIMIAIQVAWVKIYCLIGGCKHLFKTQAHAIVMSLNAP